MHSAAGDEARACAHVMGRFGAKSAAWRTGPQRCLLWQFLILVAVAPRIGAQATPWPRGEAERRVLDYPGGGVALPVPCPRELAPPSVRDDSTKKEAEWFAAWAEENAPDCPPHPPADTSTWVQATNRCVPLPFRIPADNVQNLSFGNQRIGAEWAGHDWAITLDHVP